jgi:hypothetical protein
MKRTRLTLEQIIRKFKTADHLHGQGQTIAGTYRVFEVSHPPVTAGDSSTAA